MPRSKYVCDAIQFSVTETGDQMLIWNAWIKGCWGAEEGAPGFPFSPGATFSITIRREMEHFSVWVDSKLTGEFKFRTSADKIDTVCIRGDVIVHQILMKEA